jgi:hypothetical protein
MQVVIKKGASKEEVKAVWRKLQKPKTVSKKDLKEFCGVLSLKESPLELQKTFREEWEGQ